MGKKSARRRPPRFQRRSGPRRDRRGRPGGRGPRALPVRLRPPVQGVPRPRRRARGGGLGRAPVRGARERVRLGGPARDRAGRDRARCTLTGDARRPRRSPWRPCCRWPGPPWSARTARCSSACRSPAAPATPAATSRTRCERALDGRARHAGRAEPPCPAPGPRLQDLLDPDGAARRQVHEGFDFWLEGVERPQPRGRGVAGAGQRGRRAHRAARPRSRRRTGAEIRDATTCAG